MGRYEEALHCLNEAIKINSDNEYTWTEEGHVFAGLGRFEEALKCYEKALVINQYNETLWFYKGNMLGDLNRFDDALKCFEKAIDLNPNYAQAYANRGIIFLDNREYDAAKKELNKARNLFSKINAKDDVEKSCYFESLASNASELFTKLNPLDKKFLSSLKLRSLSEFKEASIEISKETENIITEFERSVLPDDVIDLLIAKAICFTSISKILNYEDIDKSLLNKAQYIFNKWELNSFAVAVNSINLLMRFLKKYPNLNEIPEKKEKYIFESILKSSQLLNGELTEEITEKIKGESFVIKSVGAISQPKFMFINKENLKNKWVKVAIVQLDFSIQYKPHPYRFFLKEEMKEDVKEKILTALKIAGDENVDIIGFPELSFTEDLVDDVKSRYEDMIIVCGSFYDEHKYNVCPIVINNDVLPYKKCHRSIFEEPNGEGMSKGDRLFIIQTKFGKILVLNCVDFDKEFYRICNEEVDIVINPRYDIDKEHVFQKRGDAQFDQPDGSKLSTFILHVNCVKAKWADSEGGGGSCILGYEHKYRLKKYELDGLRPKDKIKYKICQAQDEMICIASLKVGSSTEKRVKMGNWFVYDSNERCWNLLQDKGIWL